MESSTARLNVIMVVVYLMKNLAFMSPPICMPWIFSWRAKVIKYTLVTFVDWYLLQEAQHTDDARILFFCKCERQLYSISLDIYIYNVWYTEIDLLFWFWRFQTCNWHIVYFRCPARNIIPLSLITLT